MTVYEITANNGKTVCREIREKMGYSLGEMAELLGISKATYQGYDQGTRTPPQRIVDAMKKAHARDVAFMRRYHPGGELDKLLDREYPRGIASE